MKLPTIPHLIDRLFISQPRLRERITRAVYGNKDSVTSIFNKPVVVNALRENGYLRAAKLSRRSSLLRDEIAVFSRLPHFFRLGTTFVDVGANIGIFSIMMADWQRFLPGFKVVAFEVHPDTYSRLAKNAATHGFTAHNIGISSQSATRSFVEGAVSHVTRMTEDSNRYIIPGRGFEARVERLDAFDITGDVVMKIDVEGHEYDVMLGCESFFAEGRVKALYIDGYDDDERVPAFLRKYGMKLYDCATLAPANATTFSLLAIKDAPAA